MPRFPEYKNFCERDAIKDNLLKEQLELIGNELYSRSSDQSFEDMGTTDLILLKIAYELEYRNNLLTEKVGYIHNFLETYRNDLG